MINRISRQFVWVYPVIIPAAYIILCYFVRDSEKWLFWSCVAYCCLTALCLMGVYFELSFKMSFKELLTMLGPLAFVIPLLLGAISFPFLFLVSAIATASPESTSSDEILVSVNFIGGNWAMIASFVIGAVPLFVVTMFFVIDGKLDRELTPKNHEVYNGM